MHPAVPSAHHPVVYESAQDGALQHSRAPYIPHDQGKMSKETVELLRIHLKRLQSVAPRPKLGPKGAEVALNTPHGPTKARKPNMIFLKPWVQTHLLHQPSPHPSAGQPATAIRYSPQSGHLLSHNAQSASFHSCSRASEADTTSTTDKRPVDSTDDTMGTKPWPGLPSEHCPGPWAVHRPISSATNKHLRNTIQYLKPVPVRFSKVQNGHKPSVPRTRTHVDLSAPKITPSAADDVHVDENRVPAHAQASVEDTSCALLIQPAPPVPRKKVWQYRQYSAHAPSCSQLLLQQGSRRLSSSDSRKRKR